MCNFSLHPCDRISAPPLHVMIPILYPVVFFMFVYVFFSLFFLSACRHPLFPLLSLLFEKCEQSTQSSDCVTSASLDIDIQNFVHNQEKEAKALFSEDTELDNLVRMRIPVGFFLMCATHSKNCLDIIFIFFFCDCTNQTAL